MIHKSAQFFVKAFNDYHDIDEHWKNLVGEWGSAEVAFGPADNNSILGLYWGLFWRKGSKPKKAQITQLLEDAGLNFSSEYTDIEY